MIYFLKDIKQSLRFWSLRMKANMRSGGGAVPAMTEPVDFVVTWVDGNDPQWKAEKEIHARKNGLSVNASNNGEERYRDWDIFRYWFRAVERYAPWVNNVYLVTCGHVPQWLNVNAPKLKLVSHEDYIPKEYLPTFNTNAIELNFHRIKELKEHFVYFNDDVFLMRPCRPEDFFGAGLPNHCAIAYPLQNPDNGGYYHFQFAAIGAINHVYGGRINDIMGENPEKWFCRQYGSEMRFNKYAAQMDQLPGMYHSHLAAPIKKTTFEEVWETYPKLMSETSSHQFRRYEDVLLQIMSMWEMMNGKFNPVSEDHFGKLFSDPVRQIDDVLDAIGSEKYCSVCINDSERVSHEEFLKTKKMLLERMEAVFPEKSSFER